jgi:2-oxo-3-hexenedioate decarboxylase
MGVDTPFVAWLTDAMILPAGDPVPQDKLIHPRIEPEIVFVMRERLEGPGVTGAQAMARSSRPGRGRGHRQPLQGLPVHRR